MLVLLGVDNRDAVLSEVREHPLLVFLRRNTVDNPSHDLMGVFEHDFAVASGRFYKRLGDQDRKSVV